MVSTYNPNPPGNGNTRWWLEDWTGGSGRDYQNQSFEEAYREFLRQSQQPPQPQPPPQQPNEGQIVNQPQDPTGTAQDPVFSTDVWGNNQPVQTIGSNIGDPTLNNYLASLPQGQGGTGGNYQTYFTGDLDTGGGASGWRPIVDGGGGGDYTTNFDFPKTGSGNALTYFNDPSSKNTYTYFDFPETGGSGDYHTYFTSTPPPKKGPGEITLKVPPDFPKKKDDEWEWPPIPQPKQQQQQQQPGVGPLLAALPMLAAFQGGTTTTPAPYAHLGPHTPVAPVFKPQGRGNPIPSIGQLLAGVR